MTISGFVLAPEYSPANTVVASVNTPPFAKRGKLNVFIVPTVTPGIKFISFIPPFINLIALFIVLSINDITPFIPVLTAPDIASPILVPKLEKVFFIPFHMLLKKLPILLNTFFIPL